MSFIPDWLLKYLRELMEVKEFVAVAIAALGFLWKKAHDKNAEMVGKNAQIADLEKKNARLAAENDRFEKELHRVSPTEALAVAKKELSQDNDGRAFSRLSTYLDEAGHEIAEVCAKVAEIHLVYASATGKSGDLREAYRFASAAQRLAPDQKAYRELDHEIGLRLTGQALTDDAPESPHEIVDWLHLHDLDSVRGFVTALQNDAKNETNNGRYAIAVRVARAAFRLAEQRLGVDDEVRLSAGFMLAQSLDFVGEFVAAEPLAREVWEKQTSVLPPDHPYTLVSGALVAEVLKALGRNAEAEPLAREVWEKQKRVLPPDHPYTLKTGELVASIANIQRDPGQNP